MQQSSQVRTVRDYMAAGFVAFLEKYGHEDYDFIVNQVMIPGFTEILRERYSGSQHQLAPEYDAILREHPQAFAHMIVMCLSLGVGFAALEEVR